MSETITISTGSRLHFGLYAFGNARPRQFGGVGAMVDEPLVVRIGTDKGPASGVGLHADAVEALVARWFQHRADEASDTALGAVPPDLVVEVLQAPPHHSGMGLGTQLGLSIAMGLYRWAEGHSPELLECATAAGRGLRSAVGTYGFFYGGLIVDQGKLPGEGVSPLQCRLDFPANWRWVLLRLPTDLGLSGEQEQAAFERLSPMTTGQTSELRRQIFQRLIPALRAQDFASFSESLYDYGRCAGECFAEIQGGPYRTKELSDLVQVVREHGIQGVGQSSWGPTLFALASDDGQAQRLVNDLHQVYPADTGLECRIVKPRNRGFTCTHIETDKKERTCRNSVSISTT